MDKNINNDIEKLKKEVWDLATNKIKLIMDQISGLDVEGITLIKEELENLKSLPAQVNALQEQKVDKQEGKDLSSNDYTDEEKNKLSSINPDEIVKTTTSQEIAGEKTFISKIKLKGGDETSIGFLKSDGTALGQIKMANIDSGTLTFNANCFYLNSLNDASGIKISSTSLEPQVDSSYNLGSSTNKFSSLYVDSLNNGTDEIEVSQIQKKSIFDLNSNNLNSLPSDIYTTVMYNVNAPVNAPVSDSGVVIQKTASSSYKTQLFIANDVNTTTWRRNYRNGVWGEWKQIANTDGKYSSLISGGNVVIDTRNIDSPPSYYKNQQVCYEFKSASAIGLDTYMPGSTYVTLKSVKGWIGSGYLVYQEAVSANNNLGAIGDGTICFRYGNNETWGEWNKITTQSLAEREMGMLLPRGSKVEQDSDINSIEYVKIGNYYCSANSTASTIQNLPEPTAFMMQVISPLSTTYDNEETSAWVYRLRILTTHTGNVYYQGVSSGATAGVFSYGAWKRVIKSDDKLLTNKMDGFNSSFNTNQTGWIRLAEINDAYSPIILVLGGGYYTSQPSDGIFAISKTYGSPPIITQLVGRKKSWWDKIRIVYGESKQYLEINKTNTSNENIRFTLISDGPTGSNITINKSFVAGAIPSGYSSVEHTLVDGTVFQDLYVKGQQELDGYLKIKGTAANRHLITRGIGGCDETAKKNDDLYLNYGTDYGVRFGKTGQGKLMPDGKINTTGLTDGTNTLLISGIATKLDIPKALSQLSQDSTHRLVTDVEKQFWSNKADYPSLSMVATTGDYADLNNRPFTSFTLEDGVLTINY